MSDKYLYILCNAGLTNRMHAIAGAARIADVTGRKLKVWWPLNRHLNAKFKRLFTNQFDFVKQEELDHLLQTETSVKFYTCGPKEDENSPGYHIQHDDPEDIVAIKTWWVPKFDGECFEDVMPDVIRRVKEFQPAPEVNELWFRYWPSITNLPELLVGLHIRYGDQLPDDKSTWDKNNVALYSKSGVSEFQQAIKQVLSLKPNAKFLLVSINPEIEKVFTQHYPGVVFSPPKSTEGRYTVTGMREALADLILLSKTDIVLGSDFSQFSLAASELGNIPLVRVGTWCWEARLDNMIRQMKV